MMTVIITITGIMMILIMMIIITKIIIITNDLESRLF